MALFLNRKLGVTTAVAALSLANTQIVDAQNQNALGDLIGAIAQGAAKAKAKKEWDKQPENIKQCINVAYAPNNLNMEGIIESGVLPTDQRIAPVVKFCGETLSRQMKTDVACNVPDGRGQQVSSICSESFAKNVNGQISALTIEQYIQSAMKGETVLVAAFETGAGKTARQRKEQQAAETERQRVEAERLKVAADKEMEQKKKDEERKQFLASPEGKRQQAAEAEKERQRIAVAASEAAKSAQVRKQFEQFAPAVNESYDVGEYGARETTLVTCRGLKKIDFDATTFKVVSEYVPMALKKFQISYDYGGQHFIFADGTELKADRQKSLVQSGASRKGFPASQRFMETYFKSTDNDFGREIGRIQFFETFDVGSYGQMVSEIGHTTTAIIDVRGNINGDPFGKAVRPRTPLHIVISTKAEESEYYIAACRVTRHKGD